MLSKRFLLSSKWSCVKGLFALNAEKPRTYIQNFYEYAQYSDYNTESPFLRFPKATKSTKAI